MTDRKLARMVPLSTSPCLAKLAWRSVMQLARAVESLLWLLALGCTAHATPIPTGHLDADRLGKLEAASANLERAVEAEHLRLGASAAAERALRQRHLALAAVKERSDTRLVGLAPTVRRVHALERLTIMNRPLGASASTAPVAPPSHAGALPPPAGALTSVRSERRRRRLQI
eukprot:scaffold30527_cov33-Phaeocystis_antarctica.AAC.2